MKFAPVLLAAAACIGAGSNPVLAQSQPAASAAPAVGAVIYGPQGNEVGKVDSVSAAGIVVDTGKNKAALPATAFATGPKGPIIGFTREQLDAAVEDAARKASAALDAALVPNTVVHTSDGIEAGSVKEITAEGNVVLDRPAGPVAMPKANFTAGAGGPVLRMTKAELDAAIARTAAAPSASGK